MGKVLSQGWGSFRDASGDVSRAVLATLQVGTAALLLTFLACQAFAATGSATAQPGVRAGGKAAKAPVATLVARPGARTSVADASTDSDGDGEPDFAEIRLGIFGINGSDADGDGMSDANEDANHNGTVDPGETDPAKSDSDGDGLSDGSDPWPVSLDGDNDGISDAAELSGYDITIAGNLTTVTTDPKLADTDGDGLSDGASATPVHQPTLFNTDEDGWNDGDEVLTAGTNPVVADTDGDGINDGVGFEASLTDVDGDGRINALDNDADNDGLADGAEDANHDGIVDANETSPILYDTDGDGLSDGYEVHTGNNALGSVDTDGDGINDGLEITTTKTNPNNADTDGDGISDGDEQTASGSLDVTLDSDGDGLLNALDSDSDNDGISDTNEHAGYPVVIMGVNTTVTTDPYDNDSDGDGLSDGFESQMGLNGMAVDTDSDGLSDQAEIATWGTSPTVADTDGDGFSDGAELVGVASTDVDADGRNNALDQDSDGDGINDSAEAGYNTDKYLADSDSDGLTDGEEVIAYHTDPTKADTDDDGLADGDEIFNITWHGHPIYLNPNNKDTDGDGVEDGVEVNSWHTNPGCQDTDGDGINDGGTLTVNYIDAAGATQTTTYVENNGDVDLDGLINALDTNSDWSQFSPQLNKDLHDRAEIFYATALSNPHSAQGWILNPGALDTDGDGQSDAGEVLNGSDPLDARVNIIGPQNIVDPDNDGLYSYEEIILGTDPQNIDSDGDGLYDGEEIDPFGIDVNHDGLSGTPADNADGIAELGGTNPLSTDSDGDGINDATEYTNGTEPNCEDSDNDGVADGTDAYPLASDFDGDRLTDSIEAALGSNPASTDTDGDGLADGAEYTQYITDILTNADADGDNVTDVAEITTYHSDPHLTDTDFDGLGDDAEVNTEGTDPIKADTDGDLLADGFEVNNGWNALAIDSDTDNLVDGAEIALGTNGLSADTDGDGINDGDEVAIALAAGNEALAITTYHADPTKFDTDGDGFWDGTADGFVDGGGNTHESVNSDADGDGITNAMDVDSDNDWVLDGTLNAGNPALDETYAADADGDTTPNILDGDSDNDGLTDPIETGIGTSLTDADTDQDGITDGNEWTQPGVHALTFTLPLKGGPAVTNDQIQSMTDPLNADTDGDGINDGREVGLTAAQTGSTATVTADADGFSDSDPRFADTDADGIGDITEVDANGDATNYGVSVTDPRDADTDDDGLLDGTEITWTTTGFSSDSDTDGIADGTELGLTAAESAGRGIGTGDTGAGLVADEDTSSHTNPLAADSDGDGLNDGAEDTNFNGAWDLNGTTPTDVANCGTITETNALATDSDNDGVADNTDAAPSCTFQGGNLYDHNNGVPFVDLQLTADINTGAFSVDVPNSQPVQTITSALADGRLTGLTVTSLMWASEIPGGYYTTHNDPYDAAAHPNLTGLTVAPGTCVALAAGDNAFTFDINLPAGTLPGIYQGWVFAVSNSDAAATDCPTSTAMSTIAPFDSFMIQITVPEFAAFGSPLTGIINNDGLFNGVGASNPANFYIPAAVDNESHLVGIPNFPGYVNGVFKVTNAAIANIPLDAHFQYVFGSGPQDPSPAIFTPASVTVLPGETTMVSVQFDTSNLPASCANGYEGTVTAYDSNNNAVDSYSVKFQLKAPDLDILDNKGSLSANSLVTSLDYATMNTNTWTIEVANPASSALNNNPGDPSDDFGCDDLANIQMWSPSTGSFTALGSMSGSTVTGGEITLYSTTDHSSTIKAQLYPMAQYGTTIGADSVVVYGLRIDKSSLSQSTPSGTYEPYYGLNNAANGRVYLTGQAVSGFASNPPDGVLYDGSTALANLVDWFNVSVNYTGYVAPPVCSYGLVPNAISTTMDPGTSKVVGTATITNGSNIDNVTLSTSGTVLTSGANALPVQVTLSPSVITPPTTSTVTVTATTSNSQAAGTYTGNVTISPSCGGSALTLAVTVTVTSRSVAFGAAPATVNVNPGTTASTSFTVTNNGTAPIRAGELGVSLTPFAQAGGNAILSGSFTPDPVGVALSTGASQVFSVSVPVAAGTVAGDYVATASATSGNVSVTQAMTVHVNPVLSSNATVSTLNLTAGQTQSLTIQNTSNTTVTIAAAGNCGGGEGETVPTLSVSPASFTNVAPGATVSFNVTANANSATAGTYSCSVTSTTSASGAQSYTQTVGVATYVPRMPSISITQSEGGVSVSGKSGETVTLEYVVNNTGNTPINAGEITQFALDGRLMTTDGRTFKSENVSISPDPATVAIPVGGRATMTVTVVIPGGQASGSYTTGVTASGAASGISLSAASTATVVVNQSRNIEYSQNPVRADEGATSVTLRTVGATGIKIYDLLGHLVASHGLTGKDAQSWTWQLRTDDGDLVPSGSYTVVISYSADSSVLSKLVVIR